MSRRTIKDLRLDLGKTPTEVAAEIGLSERHLQRLETGESPLTRRWCLAFAAYYGVDPDDITSLELKGAS